MYSHHHGHHHHNHHISHIPNHHHGHHGHHHNHHSSHIPHHAHHSSHIPHHHAHHHFRSHVVPSSARPGYSAILRHPDHPDGRLSDEHSNVHTLYDLLQRSISLYPSMPFLGSRPYQIKKQAFGEYAWKTTQEVGELIELLGQGLDCVYERHVGRGTGDGSVQMPLGIYARNRPEWVVTEFSGFRSRRYSVALYDSLSSDCLEHIINHAQLAVVVCSVDKVSTLLAVRAAIPCLRVIVSMDPLTGRATGSAAAAGYSMSSIRTLHKHAEAQDVVLMDLDSVVNLGRANPSAPRPPTSADVCTIAYTSGTTGAQKGVVSSHGAYVFAAKSQARAMPLAQATYLSFFTLGSTFERAIIYTGMLGGMRIGFGTGDMSRISEDAQALRPTVMAGVPYLFNDIYHRITAATIYAPGITGAMARTAVKQKLARLEAGKGGVKHSFWDRLVCNRMAQFFGGRLKLLISGGDPIDARVMGFLRVAISCPLLETYGAAECCSAATAGLLADKSSGHVGVPLPGVDVCLRDVPEIGFLTSSHPHPRGELLVRGPHVFAGYYKDEARSHVALDGEWLATGDLAQINDDGNIEIIDRKENVVKVAEPYDQCVALEHLETVYSRHPLVHDIFIASRPDQADLVAVVVPVMDAFVPLVQKITDNRSAPVEVLANDPQVISALQVVLYQHGKKARLRSCEMIAAVYCDVVPFDIEGNCLLTPTYKLKRRVAMDYYRKQIEAMYDQLSDKNGGGSSHETVV
ncbi:medium-chain fatty acid-CoA ligase faa2 [Coemansia interrupta]|uniref:Medium-chain fatty acid-CoA ligase faa2 n=1 Tax=Coemansia interrupta TaxID=1126814 RepID=A0A9W8HS43_9FUNG|nr:medium-chain fatty acid-CoA ligase faa2 [Coemansia interrupta]